MEQKQTGFGKKEYGLPALVSFENADVAYVSHVVHVPLECPLNSAATPEKIEMSSWRILLLLIFLCKLFVLCLQKNNIHG